jgi:3-methyl-2-oxobutanoate hydroxymethyltransferase
MSAQTITRRLTQGDLAKLYAAGEKVVMFTAYDASFARLLDGAGVECLLIGDSLGNVIQGHDTTLPVTVADIAYHTAAVKRGSTAPSSSPTCLSAATRNRRNRLSATPSR